MKSLVGQIMLRTLAKSQAKQNPIKFPINSANALKKIIWKNHGFDKITIFEGSQALVRDFKLKRAEESGRIVQNGDVRKVDGTHILGANQDSVASLNRPILAVDWISRIQNSITLERILSYGDEPGVWRRKEEKGKKKEEAAEIVRCEELRIGIRIFQ